MKYAETDRHIFMSVILSKEKTINEIIVDKKKQNDASAIRYEISRI
ncbi:MAG: hypothetical protein IPK21_19555 [Haliscomenobacter sp.]|nr:hypothetical protein [Haliscomenobacter sp.]